MTRTKGLNGLGGWWAPCWCCSAASSRRSLPQVIVGRSRSRSRDPTHGSDARPRGGRRRPRPADPRVAPLAPLPPSSATPGSGDVRRAHRTVVPPPDVRATAVAPRRLELRRPGRAHPDRTVAVRLGPGHPRRPDHRGGGPALDAHARAARAAPRCSAAGSPRGAFGRPVAVGDRAPGGWPCSGCSPWPGRCPPRRRGPGTTEPSPRRWSWRAR